MGAHGLGLYRDNAADILPWGNYEEIGIGSAIPGQQTSNAVPPSSVAWPQPFAMSTALRFDGFGSSNKQFLLGKVKNTNKTNVQVVFLSIEKDENGNANLIFNWGKNYNYNRFLIQKNVSVGQWIGVYVDFNGEIFNATNATPINLSRAIRFKLVNPNTQEVTSVVHNTTTDNVWLQSGQTMENNNDNGSYLGVGGFSYRPGGAQPLNYNHFHGALRHLTINTLRLGQIY